MWKTSLTYNSTGYKILVSRRAGYILKELKYDRHNIIYTDVDTVWLEDPRKYLTGDFDIWGARRYSSESSRVNYCTGFIVFKCTQASINMAAEWNTQLLKKSQQNQPIFNTILRKMSKLKHSLLPIDKFPTGKNYFDENKTEEVAVVHNNFIKGMLHGVLKYPKCPN